MVATLRFGKDMTISRATPYHIYGMWRGCTHPHKWLSYRDYVLLQTSMDVNMKKTAVLFTCLAIALVVAANSDGLPRNVAGATLALAFLGIAIVTMPISKVLAVGNANGRYLASVVVSEYGHPKVLWSCQYNNSLVAALMAHRQAVRHDFLGDAYGQFPVFTEVTDLGKHGSLSGTPLHAIKRI